MKLTFEFEDDKIVIDVEKAEAIWALKIFGKDRVIRELVEKGEGER